jgi:carbon storage regulator
MLVLTRKRSEMIQIGDSIVIKVIQTGRGAVKIGIEAPSEIRVLRAELCSEFHELDRGTELSPPMTADRFLAEFDAALPNLGDQFPVLMHDYDFPELLTAR